MGNEYIYKEARRLVKGAGTNDPFQIARDLGVHVIFDSDFKSLKGMYKIIQRSRFIFINGNLPSHDQRTVCAHELGHDRLHRHFAKTSALQEFMLYDMRTKPEYEANVFASELLISDRDILALIENDMDVCQIASELGEDINLVLIKIDELRKRGFDLRVPYRPAGDFLGG
ncbi:MAG: ImmA/IrrE family metallo-endopeptidase [Defluviitaleaceae bacterium]|nr:ImmA/IrrE family metallo-endopeptidase [Defluviitaleaceae bacterium]